MRVRWILPLLFLCGGTLVPAADPPNPSAEQERIRALVEAGALPRDALRKSQRAIERARWEQTVRETLFSRELTEEKVPEMLRAANELRRLARANLAHARRLAEAGALALKALETAKLEAGNAERQYDLAEQRAKLVRDLAAMARAEARVQELREEDAAFYSEEPGADGYQVWEEDLLSIDAAFYEFFGKPLPVSAQGDTVLHRSFGFNHTGRVDVDVHPDDPEGRFLLGLLDSWGIPYIAYRTSVPGQSTGPHIHIGPRSAPIAADSAWAEAER